jgi:hypothetical protein
VSKGAFSPLLMLGSLGESLLGWDGLIVSSLLFVEIKLFWRVRAKIRKISSEGFWEHYLSID